METTEAGIYIFCGVQLEEEKDFGSITVEETDRNIFTIHFKDAAMVAAEVPMKIYKPSKENLMMHQNVITKVMNTCDTVIPISFGNVFKTKEDVAVLLENLYPQSSELFPKIKGKIEVGLKVIGKKDWLEEQVQQKPEIGAIASTVHSKSEAAGYYDRIKLGEAAQKMITSLQQNIQTDIYQPLEAYAEAAVLNDPIGERMLLNASFLIDKEREAEFDEQVNIAHDQWQDKVDFQYTGPWPAYNFINIRLTVEET
ncbi:Protein GvpF [Lentibacillus sp. JNUCC-1]|nr:GvpL/GvpF family gas vesicle protein [Lentibacillus sp. JNUCC-1]MUV37889.1 Protein GvpF [Lentibacillus sp. JNUCC-1]